MTFRYLWYPNVSTFLYSYMNPEENSNYTTPEKKKRVRPKEEPGRPLKALSETERWNLLLDYLKNEVPKRQLAEMYGITIKNLDKFITTLYQKFQNVRESRMLVEMARYSDTAKTFHNVLKTKCIDSTEVNRPFLKRLSDDDEMLSDHELLFAEFYLETGDDVEAIIKSQLDIGLREGNKPSYTEGCRLRSMYLKRKPNVQAYIYEMRKRNLGVLENGKEYIQSNLIQLIEQLNQARGAKALGSQLKAIEQLARTIGAFDDKVTIETVNGDDALDRIIARAKQAREAKGALIEQ